MSVERGGAALVEFGCIRGNLFGDAAGKWNDRGEDYDDQLENKLDEYFRLK